MNFHPFSFWFFCYTTYLFNTQICMPTDSQTIAAYSPKEGDQSAFYNFQAKTDRHTARIPHKTSQNAIIPAAPPSWISARTIS